MKVVALLSGGLDSAVLVHTLLEPHELIAVSFDYGQRHKRELESAQALARHFNIEHHIADISTLRPFLAGSSQTDDAVAVPDGHYAEESMKLTVVPNRNMLMLSIAGALAQSRQFDAVVFAAHNGDHTIYPDCRADFVQAINQAMRLSGWHRVQVLAPFAEMSKAVIVRRGHELKTPFEMTWSCYKGGAVHCGKCGTCVERREAFTLAGVTDPTIYEV